jgi:uncharacterized protein (TIGR00251 family)
VTEQVWCTDVRDGIRLTIAVMPNAKKSMVSGLHGDALKIRLQAPPIDGRANEALIRYLADVLGVTQSVIAITHGQTSRRKLVLLRDSGLTVAAVTQRLFPA